MTATVVITGIGSVTPLGDDAASMWQNMLDGKSGISPIDGDWVEPLPVNFAGQVSTDLSPWVSRVAARRMDRGSQLALGAAHQAWADAGFGLDEENPVDPDRLGVSIGTGIGGLNTTLDQWDTYKDKGLRRMSPFTVPALMANAPAAQVGLMVKARAGVHAPVSACASGNEAIAHGLDMIRLGRADVVIVGGVDSTINAFGLGGFIQMQALSRRVDEPQRASRPWDVDRDGFVLSEGAAVLVLETLEHAQARGARIYGTLRGAGISADAHDLVQPDPEGIGQIAAMTRALKDAGMTPADIAHVNAHGTSTPQGDTTEAHSIRTALGSDVDHVVVTSTKSTSGHMLGAAGAAETIAALMAVNKHIVPPTINLDTMEEGLGIDIAANQPRELADGQLAAINNSFGFGGHNVAVVVTNENAS